MSTAPKDVVCFDVSIPEKPHLLFWWLRNGIEQCRIEDDGVLHLADGVTAEDALVAAARVIGDQAALRGSVEDALRELGTGSPQ